MKLKRVGDEVFFEGRRLTIVRQQTKGQGHEVVKVEGLPMSEGRKWLSLNLLTEGENDIDMTASTHSKRRSNRDPMSSGYRAMREPAYTLVERARIAEFKLQIEQLERQVKEIEAEARARTPDIMSPDQVRDLPPEARHAYVDKLKAYIDFCEGGGL